MKDVCERVQASLDISCALRCYMHNACFFPSTVRVLVASISVFSSSVCFFRSARRPLVGVFFS